MFSKAACFSIGIIVGVYLEQTYRLPSINVFINRGITIFEGTRGET